MSERFDIQEILSQDEAGVRFRAVDRQNAAEVCLRRFFPFGLEGGEGGGMEAHERDEYLAAVAEIMKLAQPRLRPVLDGGCDPVDGIPYLVYAGAEGEALAALCTRSEFGADAAAAVLEQALAVCEAVSVHIGAEALWVDTSLDAIVMDAAEGGHGVTFELSPIRWLVDTAERRSLLPLAGLAEDLMGWRGRLIAPQAAGGLGAWIKWVRGPGRTRSLAEARAMLLKLTGKTAPAPEFKAEQVTPAPRPASSTSTNTHPGPKPATPTSPSASAAKTQPVAPPVAARPPRRAPWIIGALSVAILAVGAWIVLRPKPAAETSAAAPLSSEEQRLAEINAKAARLTRGSAPVAATDTSSIAGAQGTTLSIEGEVTEIKASASGQTLYLIFGGGAVARGRVVVKNAGPELSADELKKWVGKRVRLTGQVAMEGTRPEVTITSANSITEAK